MYKLHSLLLIQLAALIGVVSCASQKSPEKVAEAYVKAIGDPRTQIRYLNGDDSMRTAAAQDSAPFGLMLGWGLQARWVEATEAAKRLVIDSAVRLPVPAGDTTVVVVYLKFPSRAAADSILTSAVNAGLVTDKASTDLFMTRTWATVPLEEVQDTSWLIQSSGQWRIWTGVDVRARVDSLMRIVDPQTQDTAVIPFATRRTAAEALQRIAETTPPAIVDDRLRKDVARSIRSLRTTEEMAHELRPTAVISTTEAGRQTLTLDLGEVSAQRLFSLKFFVRDIDGHSSGIIDPMMLWGGTVHQFDVLPMGESYGSQARLKDGPATVEFVSAFEMDVDRMRREFGNR